jgi:hypothetical protein
VHTRSAQLRKFRAHTHELLLIVAHEHRPNPSPVPKPQQPIRSSTGQPVLLAEVPLAAQDG